MFSKSARVYDLIYLYKDYSKEAAKIQDIISRYAASGGNALLDVGCGTGVHASYFVENFAVTGLDLDVGLLEVARERVPQATFHLGDMRDFDLGQQFDAVVCLFSAIGYVGGVEALNATLVQFAKHTKPGGAVIVEPWFPPGFMAERYVSANHIDRGRELQIVRMSRTTIEGDVSVLHFHYMVGTPDGVEYFKEEHRLTLFTKEQYVAAFEGAGLAVTHEEYGLTGRGLYIGRDKQG